MPNPLKLKFAAVYTAVILIVTICSVNAATEQAVIQHDAHQHGRVVLNIALEGQMLFIELDAPGADVVGFENLPATDEQRQLLSAAIHLLERPQKLFSFPGEAECKLQSATVSHHSAVDTNHHDNDHDEKGHDEKHEEEHHDEPENSHDDDNEKDHDEEHDDAHENGHDDAHENQAGHGSFTAQYQFQCKQLAQLNTISTHWFSHFPNTELISVQLLTQTQQSVQILDSDNPDIHF